MANIILEYKINENCFTSKKYVNLKLMNIFKSVRLLSNKLQQHNMILFSKRDV